VLFGDPRFAVWPQIEDSGPACAALLHAFEEDLLRKSIRINVQRTPHSTPPPEGPRDAKVTVR
jgi:hypothetical protein